MMYIMMFWLFYGFSRFVTKVNALNIATEYDVLYMFTGYNKTVPDANFPTGLLKQVLSMSRFYPYAPKHIVQCL